MALQGAREAVIVGAARTPIGRGHALKGYYRDWHPADLLGLSYRELLARTGVDPSVVELAIAGCVQQIGPQSFDIARNAWLQEGLPIETSATTLDIQCGSGQQAVGFAASLVASGVHDVVIAGGVEHMGRLPFSAGERVQDELGSPWTKSFFEHHAVRGQGIGAELIAAERGMTRSQLDQLALLSHQRAAAAAANGVFKREIIPVHVDGQVVEVDQGIRPDTSMEALAALKPVFSENGVVTAGTASQVSDGAAALMITTPEMAAELGVTPRARIVDTVSVGCDPVKMLEGPIPATHKILERNGLSVDDLDFIEINEAFAPVVQAWADEFKVDFDRINPRGGAMALGHPLGSTGARLLTSLLHELEDEDKEFGLVTMCCGGGLGTATLLQRL
jgi:acetyl-CoA acetyltransferase family protein